MKRKNKPPHPNHKDRRNLSKRQPFAWHARNPAGTKLLMRFYKAKHGTNAKTIEEARAWYAGYLSDLDAKARKAEWNRKIDRQKRRFPFLAERFEQLRSY